MADKDSDDRLRSTVAWKDEPEEHDFPAAAAYLALVAPANQVSTVFDRLRRRRPMIRRR